MKEIELNELTLPEKINCYQAFCHMCKDNEQSIAQTKQMVAMQGAEMTLGRIAEVFVKDGQELPVKVMEVLYNALLYMQELNHS